MATRLHPKKFVRPRFGAQILPKIGIPVGKIAIAAGEKHETPAAVEAETPNPTADDVVEAATAASEASTAAPGSEDHTLAIQTVAPGSENAETPSDEASTALIQIVGPDEETNSTEEHSAAGSENATPAADERTDSHDGEPSAGITEKAAASDAAEVTTVVVHEPPTVPDRKRREIAYFHAANKHTEGSEAPDAKRKRRQAAELEGEDAQTPTDAPAADRKRREALEAQTSEPESATPGAEEHEPHAERKRRQLPLDARGHHDHAHNGHVDHAHKNGDQAGPFIGAAPEHARKRRQAGPDGIPPLAANDDVLLGEERKRR